MLTESIQQTRKPRHRIRREKKKWSRSSSGNYRLGKVEVRLSIRINPRLQLKFWILKRNWAIVYDMLSGKNNSGFGWSEHRQLVVAEDALWNSYINSYKEAGQFKHRSFPYYD